MATYSYACGSCSLTCEVGREPSRADDEAYCPVWGEAIGRLREGAKAKAKSFARLLFHGHGDGPGQHRRTGNNSRCTICDSRFPVVETRRDVESGRPGNCAAREVSFGRTA
jgi:hypothetical protein